MHSNNILHLVCVNEPTSVVRLLEDQAHLSMTKIEELLRLGSLYLNKKRIDQDSSLKPGDYVRVHSDPRRYDRPLDLEKRILFQNEHWIVVDKPSGVPCHATVDNSAENLLKWFGEICGHSLHITHRLDVPTSGCLLIAKSPAGSSRFNKLLLKNRVEKEYEILVEGNFQETGLIQHWMKDDPWAPRHVEKDQFENSIDCRMVVLSSEAYGDGKFSKVRVRLETGRTHQIRAQMKALGHPVINDEMYGAPKRWENQAAIGLRAAKLSYTEDPADGPQSFETSLDWETLFPQVSSLSQ